MVIYDGKNAKEYSWSKGHFYFVDTPCEKRRPGYPLDSISVMPENNKYWLELTGEEKEKYQKWNSEDGVVDFIVNSIDELVLEE